MFPPHRGVFGLLLNTLTPPAHDAAANTGFPWARLDPEVDVAGPMMRTTSAPGAGPDAAPDVGVTDPDSSTAREVGG